MPSCGRRIICATTSVALLAVSIAPTALESAFHRLGGLDGEATGKVSDGGMECTD